MNKNVLGVVAGAALTLLSGCQVFSGERSVNQYSSDAAITANVKAELLHEPRITSLPIHVDTDQGVVILTGVVKTKAQKIAAGHAASQAKGARTVHNELVVRR